MPPSPRHRGRPRRFTRRQRAEAERQGVQPEQLFVRRRKVYRKHKDPFEEFPDDKDFISRYRLPKWCVQAMSDEFAASGFCSTKGDRRGGGFSVRERMCLALRYFATGANYSVIRDSQGTFGKATVSRAVNEVIGYLNAIYDGHIQFPHGEGVHVAAAKFRDRFDIDGCVGVVDGTYVPIIKPIANEAAFLTRHHYYGMNVLKMIHKDEDDMTTDFSKDENEDRGNWTGKADFLLACLGFAVGLGNVWRFPYLCYKNGGAVFFIPYVIMLAVVGMPIFVLELSLGQYTSSGPLTTWKMAPMFKGVGVAMVCVSFMVGIYYNMIIAWAVFYLFASFTSELPWATCGNQTWATAYCREVVNCTEQNYTLNTTTGLCYDGDVLYGIQNVTLAAANNISKVLPSKDYLNNYVLDVSADIDNIGFPRWQLVLCLILSWLIVCLSLINGIKSSGKVVYFTALFPYVVLVILLVRGLTLPGYYEGIEFYILKPDLSKLSEAAVWKDAAVQIFFSLSASWGGLITLSSYNRFHNDVIRDSMIVSLGNCLTSFFAGFVIFSFLGFQAHELQTTVDKVADGGVDLAFTVYPDAVTRMPVSPLWAILFFVMLITLGLDSEFALVETVTTTIMDQWPATRKRKWLVIIGCSVFMFILGLPLTCPGGKYVLTVMDNYAGGWNVLVIALLECICIAYVYGAFRFRDDIGTMIGSTGCGCFNWSICSGWWIINWAFLTPVGVLFILVFSWVDYSRTTYSKDNPYPLWADGIGWALSLLVVACIIVTAIILVIITPGRFTERMQALLTPTDEWGPALVKHRKRVKHLPGFIVDPWGNDPQHLDSGLDLGHIKVEAGHTNLGYD